MVRGGDITAVQNALDSQKPQEYSLDLSSSRLMPLPRLTQAVTQHQAHRDPMSRYWNNPSRAGNRTVLNSRSDRLARQPLSSRRLLQRKLKESESAQSIPKSQCSYLFKKYEDPHKIKDVLTSRAQQSILLKVRRQDRAVERFRHTRGDFFYPKEMAAEGGLKSLPKSHRDYEYREEKQMQLGMVI